MIPVKIQCACGQRYAFDVEPVGGHMPYPVKCPSCGADGTVAANAVIAEGLAAQPAAVAALVRAVAVPANNPLRVTATAPAVQRAPPAVAIAAPPAVVARSVSSPQPQTDRTRIINEARAKTFWGDPPGEVTKYLMMNGIEYEEAAGLAQGMARERAVTIRGIGLRKVFIGSGLVAVPIVAYIIFARMGVIPLKLFAITIMVGLWGAWMLLKGSMMLLAPRMETGDVADQ